MTKNEKYYIHKIKQALILLEDVYESEKGYDVLIEAIEYSEEQEALGKVRARGGFDPDLTVSASELAGAMDNHLRDEHIQRTKEKLSGVNYEEIARADEAFNGKAYYVTFADSFNLTDEYIKDMNVLSDDK